MREKLESEQKEIRQLQDQLKASADSEEDDLVEFDKPIFEMANLNLRIGIKPKKKRAHQETNTQTHLVMPESKRDSPNA